MFNNCINMILNHPRRLEIRDKYVKPLPDGCTVAFLFGWDPYEDAITTAFVGDEGNVSGPRCSDAR